MAQPPGASSDQLSLLHPLSHPPVWSRLPPDVRRQALALLSQLLQDTFIRLHHSDQGRKEVSDG
jgi:hypothetical protein